MSEIVLPTRYSKLKGLDRMRVRERYAKEQGGKCWYCGNPLQGFPTNTIAKAYINTRLFPKGFFTHPIHLHHDHRSDMTIGAVHARCNAYLWQYEGQ